MDLHCTWSEVMSDPTTPAPDLPPLPKPAGTLHDDGYWTLSSAERYEARLVGWKQDHYTAEQMQSYARAALAGAQAAQPARQTPAFPKLTAPLLYEDEMALIRWAQQAAAQPDALDAEIERLRKEVADYESALPQSKGLLKAMGMKEPSWRDFGARLLEIGREQGRAEAAVQAAQPVPTTCPQCGTHEVALTLECHNSACAAYAETLTVYTGWKPATGGGNG
jgi:hypothetical protein